MFILVHPYSRKSSVQGTVLGGDHTRLEIIQEQFRKSEDSLILKLLSLKNIL